MRGGGLWPKWRSDSKELFYIALDGKLMSVDIVILVKPGRRLSYDGDGRTHSYTIVPALRNGCLSARCHRGSSAADEPHIYCILGQGVDVA